MEQQLELSQVNVTSLNKSAKIRNKKKKDNCSRDHNRPSSGGLRLWQRGVVMWGGHTGGSFHCTGEIIGLRSIYSYFFRASERGEAARIEKRMLQLEFHIQAWPAFLKEPLRCGFKRNSLCGSGAGREPFMVETLQCVSAQATNDLACCLKWGWGREIGCFNFISFFSLLDVFFFPLLR